MKNNNQTYEKYYQNSFIADEGNEEIQFKKLNPHHLNEAENISENRLEYDIFLDSFIKETSMEELVQMMLDNKCDAVYYIEMGIKKLLLGYLIRTDTKILDNGKYLVKYLVKDICFTQVNEYRRIIVYDHIKEGKCYYTNNLDQFNNSSTSYILPVYRYLTKIRQTIGIAIIERFF